MSTGAMDPLHMDETACGPLCQHPQCWASNRRVERGLPRVAEALLNLKDQDDDDDIEGSLPTVKVHNLLDEYGQSQKDRYPSRKHGKDTMTPPLHLRSASAPNIMAANNRSPVFAPFTPFTSPLGVRGGSVRSARSAGSTKTPTRTRSKATPKISRVEVREMLGDLSDLPSLSAGSSSFYIWCPSKKTYERQSQRKEIPQSTSKEPMTVQPKDVTDDMVPNRVERKKRSKHQKNNRASHDTPTGGRPYTHPTRSPPPVNRRTLPQDVDDGITELLSLPRDVLVEVLDHIKKSDLLDKSKLQMLIGRIMPHIHFQQDSPPTPKGSVPTPLLDSGILQNHKVTLHNMEEKPLDKHKFLQAADNVPFFVDETVLSRMASSVYDGMEEQEEQQREEMELPMTQSTGRMAKTKPLAPIKGHHHRDPEPVYKLSSVSAKSLPPLKPGVRPVKPFDYTNSGLSLDLTLVPLTPPKSVTPERATQTPYSGVASTIHVTVPSVPSDRTLSTSPAMPYSKSPVPQLGKSCTRSSPSPLPSEEFRALRSLTPIESTKVPKTPQGTPATEQGHRLYTRECYPSKVSPEHREGSLETSRTVAKTTEPGLDTIHETGTVNSTCPAGESTAGFNSRSDYVMSPNKQLDSSMSPYGFSESIAALNSEKESVPAVPVTPAPTSATEDSWPVIDERDFLQSPDACTDPLLANQKTELPAPVAPPPSPEPRDPNPEYEFELPEVNKSAGSSLTPLAEEEEELDQSEKDLGCDDQPAEQLPTNGTIETDKVNNLEGVLETDTLKNQPSRDINTSAEISNSKMIESQKGEQITDTGETPEQDESAVTRTEADSQVHSVGIKEELKTETPQYSKQEKATSQIDGNIQNKTQSDNVVKAGIGKVTFQIDDVTQQESTKLTSKRDDVTKSDGASATSQSNDVTNSGALNMISNGDKVTNTTHENVKMNHNDITNSDYALVETSTSGDAVQKTHLLKEEVVSKT